MNKNLELEKKVRSKINREKADMSEEIINTFVNLVVKEYPHNLEPSILEWLNKD